MSAFLHYAHCWSAPSKPVKLKVSFLCHIHAHKHAQALCAYMCTHTRNSTTANTIAR